MSQARIVLRDAALEQGERLLKVTRLATLTELINVMFSRYGRHLEETWEVLPSPYETTGVRSKPVSQMVVPTSIPETDQETDFTFDKPICGL
ncbi:hypothetical protein NIES4101_26260 (plasmid) [Calothrix sp. NIES-4101]|nr:hypothetical protein NIES4101_26260 [Calothrix sp. NIES-4101]